jgi:isopenicillin-N N-acyltransferase-like protein
MQTTDTTLQYLTLTGSPRERGRIHGETLRAEIREVMDRWEDALQSASKLRVAEFLDRLCEETNFVPAIERWTPGLLEEVRGIADGANMSFRDVYAYQLVDEHWIFIRQLQEARQLAEAPGEHCTVVAAFDPAGEAPVLAQNMDLPKFYDGAQVLMQVKDANSDLESLILTVAGLIVTTGVNSCGIACCCNTVSQLASSRDGLPVAFIVRNVLAHETRADAVRFVTSIHQASGQNYMVGGPDGITSLECSANKCVEFQPLPSRIYHTNHPVVNDDLETRPNGKSAAIPDPITGTQRCNTEIRFDAAAAALEDAPEPATAEVMKSILSNPESLICAMRDSAVPSFTFGSVVYELSVPPVLHLAPGPPAVTEYRAWTFD